MMDALRTASAIVVEQDGENCHAAVVGMSLEIPVIYGAKNATNLLRNGTHVTVDAKRGMVYANNK